MHNLSETSQRSGLPGDREMVFMMAMVMALNALAIASLRRDYEMFAINCQDDEATNAFAEAMRAFRATWLWHPLPRPYEGARAVLLPRDERRSMRVAIELRRAGVVDLGAHLAALCARQNSQGDGEKSLSGDGSS